MGSALGLSQFAAQNSNIANDGSADSPRGFGSVTTTGTFTMTATGPSLYRVVVATPAAPITAALPTTVKQGYRCRIEVELTGSTETNCFFTSPAIAEAQINGTGFVELMALVDNPSTAGNWKVTDVVEKIAFSWILGQGAGVGANYGTSKNATAIRRGDIVTMIVNDAYYPMTTGTGATTTISSATNPVPVRFRPTFSPVCSSMQVTDSTYQGGYVTVNTVGNFAVTKFSNTVWTSSAGIRAFGDNGTTISYVK